MVLVDISVWSLLFRRSGPATQPEVEALQRFLGGDELVAITGIIAQELTLLTTDFGLHSRSASRSTAVVDP